MPIVGCFIFFIFMNEWDDFGLVDGKMVFLEGREEMFVWTVVGPVGIIVEFFVFNYKRLFVSPAD